VENPQEQIMKKAIAGAVLTLLTVSLPAMAAVTYKYQFKGNNAYASFYTYDECSSTSLNVSAYDSITKDGPGAPTSQVQAYLDYYSYNYCTERALDVADVADEAAQPLWL